MTTVLIIDDEESICWGLSQLCKQLQIDCQTASGAEQGLLLASQTKFDVIVMDVRLPGMSGLQAIEEFQTLLGPVPIVIITAFGDLQTAIQAIQAGAFEYIAKPFALDKVRDTILQAIATAKLRSEHSSEPSTDQSPDRHDLATDSDLIGSSRMMQEVFKQIALTTTAESSVLITGESGTGKELTARTIHRFGQRADGPFVAVNLSAMNLQHAESELFGQVNEGSANQDSARVGLIQQAQGGTLFLDEVAELPLELQVKMLRVLDLGEFTPVGSLKPVKADFRLISATDQDLLTQINHGEFRHDFFYRLRTFEIKLPPLRHRREDLPELVDYFLSRSSVDVTATPEFMRVVSARNWPGNIRELQSVVERAAMLARAGVLTADHISESDQPISTKSQPHNQTGTGETLTARIQMLIAEWTQQHWNDDNMELLYASLLSVIDPAILQTAFTLSDRQYSPAARRLGIHRTTLKKKLEEAEQTPTPPRIPTPNEDEQSP